MNYLYSVQNLTRKLKKINYIWNKSQAPSRNPCKLNNLDKLLIFLVCFSISIITAFELATDTLKNFNLIIKLILHLTEIFICSGVLVYVSKKENPIINFRQILLIIGFLLLAQIIKFNFEEISPLLIIIPPSLIISQVMGTITALSWVSIASINWPSSGGDISNSLLLITFLSSFIVAMFGGKIRSRSQLLQIALLVPLGSLLSQWILLGINNDDLFFFSVKNLISKPGNIISDSFLLAILMLMAIIFMPILESIFGLVTKARLLELADQENPLLRRLSIEAPGTFEHTLLLCGLAEEATRMIDGDVDLVKTGALYHDVGKLHAPEWFIENQNSRYNPHDELDDPLKSAKILQEHVDKGLQIARKYRLPKPIADFIPEHQGTLKMGYFLFKAKEIDKNVSENNFKYKGPIPQSKETAILMLADGCEAALRAMKIDASDEDALLIISKLINSRIADGQLCDSNLSTGEIFLIKRSFLNVWKRIRHRRIQYPSSNSKSFS